MDFITLDQAVDGISGPIEFPEGYSRRHADLRNVYKTSEAAANLHQQLHNFPELRPKWVVLHPVTDRPVFDDTVAEVGMELLVAMSGDYLRAIGQDNSVPSLELTRRKFPSPPMGIIPHGRKYRHFLKSPGAELGFDRYQLVGFLNDPRVGLDHYVRGGVIVEEVKRPLPQHHQKQEDTRVIAGAPDSGEKVEARAVKRTAPELALPDKADPWAKAIEATYEIMVLETGAAPSGTEVWLRMNDKPPPNYPMKITKDHGLAAIAMPGEKLLTRDGFLKRWSRYTDAK